MHTYKSARTRRTDTHTHFAYDHSTDTDRRQRHSAPMVQTLVLCYIPPFHSTSSLAYAALVVVELQRGLDVVGERPQLLLAEQVLVLSNAKTRSQEAEFGEMAKTTRAASAHAGKVALLRRHQSRIASE